MAVKIRLARFGRNKVPFYHIVATDSRNRRDGKFLEKIGTYNPLLNDDNSEKLVIKKDRAEYWLSVGALPTDRVALLLIKAGVKINYECSCSELIKLNKDLWVEDDNYLPKIGDLVLYDW